MKICDVLDLLGISQSKLASQFHFHLELNWRTGLIWRYIPEQFKTDPDSKEDVIFYSTIPYIDGRAGGNGGLSQQQVFVRVDQESDQATHQSLQHNQQNSQQFSCSGNFCLVLLDKIV